MDPGIVIVAGGIIQSIGFLWLVILINLRDLREARVIPLLLAVGNAMAFLTIGIFYNCELVR